ncbi:nephrin-like protein, partial [Leptotrombidium deliense]
MSTGTTLKLPCVVRNLQGECLWIHDGTGVGKIVNKYEFKRQPENGDCSLTIKDLQLDRDDGLWQCQVTPVSLHDFALLSETVKVTVLIAPHKPMIKGIREPGSRLEKFAVRESDVECSIAKGNPPPIIYWYLNDENITDKAVTVTSQTPTPKPETLNTISTLRIPFKKENNNATLMCVAIHPLANQTVSALLNIYYAPEVDVEREKYTIVEGNERSIECKVDSNPPATVIWRRHGTNPRFGRNVLYFERVTRDLNGMEYECTAQNEYGVAKPANVKFDVLYNPTVVNVSYTQSVLTGSRARLYCYYDGNPSPIIRWFHINPRTGAVSLVKNANGKNQHILD